MKFGQLQTGLSGVNIILVVFMVKELAMQLPNIMENFGQ
mgnify:CR=1 FL=1